MTTNFIESLSTLEKSAPQGGLFGNYPGKDTYYMILDQKIAEKAAERTGGGLGLQEVLYNQLSAGGRRYGKAQEKSLAVVANHKIDN